MSDLRTAAQQALEALEAVYGDSCDAIHALRAALAQEQAEQRHPPIISNRFSIDPATGNLGIGTPQEQAETEGRGNLPPPLQEPAVAENATTQQQLEDTPPSDYRRGYWDGFNIGKREGRIEAEDAAQQAEPVQEPVAMDWLHKWANQDDGEPETQWHEGYEAARRVVQIHLTAPPQRRPLTDEEIDRIDQSIPRHTELKTAKRLFARAIERAIKEKDK